MKWHGLIGYDKGKVETSPGVWEEQIETRPYYGEITRDIRRLQSADQVNDNVNVSNELSIVADPFAYENFLSMRYVEFLGAQWKIINIEVRHPRLILQIGGVYNGKKT